MIVIVVIVVKCGELCEINQTIILQILMVFDV